MKIPIIFEDNNILVINKPANLLVHPLDNHAEESLVDWLKEYLPGFTELNWPDSSRPGIVHRLDKDTSGVMVVAKNPDVLKKLQEQFANREIQKNYCAITAGNPTWDTQTIIAAISRGEGTRRKAGFLRLPGQVAKEAETIFTIQEHFQDAAFITAEPKTGRTHQIRVHLDLAGYPILGDPWYQTKLSRQLAKDLSVPRLMLHAHKIKFEHPTTQQVVEFEAPLPEDFHQVLSNLKGE